MKITAAQLFQEERHDPRLFADLMHGRKPVAQPAIANDPQQQNGGSVHMLAGDGTPVLGNFSANAFPLSPDHGMGSAVLGSLSQRPDSYHGNMALKQAQFYGYGNQLEPGINSWNNARLGASETTSSAQVPAIAAGSSDLSTDALSAYKAQLKITNRSDAGAYHYGEARRVSLDHGLENYIQVINLAGGQNKTGAPGASV